MSYRNEKIINFTHQHFSDYYNDKLSLDDKYLFERKLRNDPFFKDAYDGFKTNPQAFASLSRLELKKKKFTSSYLTLVVVSFIALFFVSGFLFFYIQNDVRDGQSNALYEINTKNELKKIQLKESQISIANVKTSEVEEVVKPKVVYTQLVEEEKQKERLNEIEVYQSNNVNKTEEPLVYVEHKKQLKKIELKPALELETKLIPLVSIHGLINVNYEKIEDNKTIAVQTFIINGTPANKENDASDYSEPSHQTQIIKVPYVNYLSNIQFDFSHNKFKKALKGYQKILEQYPNDLNAHFYSAICYYNLNQSEKALSHLQVVKTHRFDTFRQEGDWYKASVLYDLGRKEESIELLDYIIKKEGFYANQAKEMKLNIQP